MKHSKNLPMHGSQAQLRVTSDGKAETINDVVDKEFDEAKKKGSFSKIYKCLSTNKKKK